MRAGNFKIVLLLAVAVFAVFVWPTRYRYDHMKLGDNNYPVRANRLTGKTEVLAQGGWIEFPKAEGDRQEQDLPVEPGELTKITGHAGLDSVGYFKGDIYNGNTFDLGSIVVEVEVQNSDKSTDFTRTYDLRETFRALSDTEIIERTDISLGRGQSISWSIKSAVKKSP